MIGRGWRFVGVCTLVVACCAIGCADSGNGPRKVSNPNPSAKIPAIKDAVRTHDTKETRQMVADLESDDPAVRFYAIEGLRRITGQDFGYVYYADDDARKPAVHKWKEWLAK